MRASIFRACDSGGAAACSSGRRQRFDGAITLMIIMVSSTVTQKARSNGAFIGDGRLAVAEHFFAPTVTLIMRR